MKGGGKPKRMPAMGKAMKSGWKESVEKDMKSKAKMGKGKDRPKAKKGKMAKECDL